MNDKNKIMNAKEHTRGTITVFRIRCNRIYRIVLLRFANNINGKITQINNQFHSTHSALCTDVIQICIHFFPVNCFSLESSMNRNKTFSTWKKNKQKIPKTTFKVSHSSWYKHEKTFSFIFAQLYSTGVRTLFLRRVPKNQPDKRN